MGNSGSTAVNSEIPSAAQEQRSQSSSATSTSGRDECPVLTRSSGGLPAVYDVYGQNLNDPNRSKSVNPALEALKSANVLDPRNNMPLEPNQLPCPGQRKQLPTERALSSIPKGGVDGTWTFPSPQMVFNGTPGGDSALLKRHACMPEVS